MRLAETFLQHIHGDAWSSFAATPSLEEGLQRLLHEGARSWPGLEVAPERYVEFLARHLPPEVARSGDMDQLQAGDLYLVCAYALKLRAAYDVMEAQVTPRVRHALGRLGTPAPVILDIQQELRERLVEMADPAVTRRGYSGRGELVGWMILCAVREARSRRSRARQELAVENEQMAELSAEGADPEQEMLIRTYRQPFQRAFTEALASLSSRDRNLLRHRFVSCSSIDQIAGIYAVHRATAARWVLRAQGNLLKRMQALFLDQVPMGEEGMAQIVVALRSQLSLDLAEVLPAALEPEAD